ncbi:cytochrome P450 9e2-like [Schistocerca serialis cubense]|uniref:cytochrome P450 9e2-like n=1 Tax=Schistocerca serialis cubense TaxID=2023355 RepID=UPI00214ECDFB|nr:cytochrome P450 9e2-like [Schistocerca serialis cubense]
MAPDWWKLSASAALVAVTLVLLWWRRYATKFSRAGVPSLPPLPVVGNMLDVVLSRKAMPEVVVDMYRHFQKHPYAGFYTFAKSLVLVRDPDLIRSITVKDFDHFTDHVDFLNTDKGHPVQQRMLIFMKGKEWHDMRATLSPAFTSKKMRNMFLLIAEIGQQVVEYITKECAKVEVSSGGNRVLTLEMKDLFTRVTNDVIATTAFGVKVDSLAEPNNTFYTTGRELTTIKSGTVIGYMLVPRLMQLIGAQFINMKAVEFFRTMLTETIKTREEQGIVRHDMIHLMMQARRGELAPEEGEANGTTDGKRRHLTDDDITAQALIFFIAGFDTVSTLLTFCSYLLATNEDVQQRLQREVDDLMQKSGGQPSYEQVLGCQYLDMVLSETLRMYTPLASLDRTCVRSYRLPATESCPGLELRPGDGVWMPVLGIHYDPDYFPDPERFDPERFSPERKHLIKPFTYFPFGSGPRICIAQRFALMESKVVLVHLLSRFSLQAVAKTPVPLRLQPDSATLTVRGGAWLGIRSRV